MKKQRSHIVAKNVCYYLKHILINRKMFILIFIAFSNSVFKIRFSVGNICNSMLHEHATLYRGPTCFKNLLKHQANMKIMVFKILYNGAQNHKMIT